MRFYKLNGFQTNKDVTKYLIKWNKKSKSKYQQSVKKTLETLWLRHIVYEEFPVVGTKMTLDFVNLTLKVAIEVQGEQHLEFNDFFHNGSRINFYDQISRDVQKKKWCELNGLELIEIFPTDIPLTNDFIEKYIKK